jgi:SAM-dependent methyltransferase
MHGIETNPYPLPNDDEEIVRLDELQFVIRGLFGPNILAPISRNPTAILDLGTGSGRYHPICTEAYYSWCFEVADQFPDARVVGIDLSPVQPTAVPDNCEFIVADFTEGLEFDNGSLDLVHSRLHLPKSQ